MSRSPTFDRQLTKLTDEAIREALAEISVEFERRFGKPNPSAFPADEIARLREVLEPLMRQLEMAEADPLPEPLTEADGVFVSMGDLRAIRAALNTPRLLDALTASSGEEGA